MSGESIYCSSLLICFGLFLFFKPCADSLDHVAVKMLKFYEMLKCCVKQVMFVDFPSLCWEGLTVLITPGFL